MRLLLLAFTLRICAVACDCSYRTVCETLARSEVIFIGEVIDGGIDSLAEDPWHSRVTRARFKVLEVFRGLSPGTQTVEVRLSATYGMCDSNPYFRGKRYLVTPSLDENDGSLSEMFCFTGKRVETAADEIRYIRDYFARGKTADIHGTVAAAQQSRLEDYLLYFGRARPLAGVRVTATRGGEVFSAATNEDGEYFLALPGGGSYAVQAILSPFRSPQPKIILIPPNGCVVENFGLTNNNVVSGRVVTPDAKPVSKAMVGLIDLRQLDNPPVVLETTSDANGNYQIDRVPAGRYLLAIDPWGPRPGSPFETTYYPRAGGRDAAQPFEFNSGGIRRAGVDLVVGRSVAFRQVTVKAEFADGEPMTMAQLRFTQQPANPGDRPWRDNRVADKTGSVTTVVPANRPLHIELKDWHGRDLGATYAAGYEPGATPITHKFVVKP